MRTTLKIVLPLIVSVSAVSLLFAAYQVRTEKRILRNDLSRRAEILGESLQESVEPLLERAPERGLQRLVERFGQREHLKGVAVYNGAVGLFGDDAAARVYAARRQRCGRQRRREQRGGEALAVGHQLVPQRRVLL